MSEQSVSKDQPTSQVPEQCAECKYLDKQSDHMLEVPQVHLYCRSPWWHPKRWSCSPPPGVERG